MGLRQKLRELKGQVKDLFKGEEDQGTKEELAADREDENTNESPPRLPPPVKVPPEVAELRRAKTDSEIVLGSRDECDNHSADSREPDSEPMHVPVPTPIDAGRFGGERQRRGSYTGRGAGSFGSASTDRELPDWSADPLLAPIPGGIRSAPGSFTLPTATYAGNPTGSFGSTATDWDYLTSPGAQAELSVEYRQAVYGPPGSPRSSIPVGGIDEECEMLDFGAPGSTGSAPPGAKGGAAGGAGSFDAAAAIYSQAAYQQALMAQFAASPAGPALAMGSAWPGPGSCPPPGAWPGLPGYPPVDWMPYAAATAAGAAHAAPWGFTSPQGSSDSAADLAAQAQQLDHAAHQLMAAARRAKAAARQAWSQAASPATGGSGGAGSGGATAGAALAATASPKEEQDRTTVMLRNLPNDYTRDMLLELLDAQGFGGTYDFVYLPVDFKRWAGLGYAFVNMISHEEAQRMRSHFQGFDQWKLLSSKVCDVAWGEPLQGLQTHVERYRNSPVMHADVPAEVKPVLFSQGQRISFPAPTRRLRPPRVKCRSSGDASSSAMDASQGHPGANWPG